jgi:hypothetical protein
MQTTGAVQSWWLQSYYITYGEPAQAEQTERDGGCEHHGITEHTRPDLTLQSGI